MTETGKSEEAGELPLEGSPNRKEVAEVESAREEDVSSPAVVVACQTPTSNRLREVDSFKTPEATTPSTSSAKKRKRLTPDEKMLREKERQEKRRKLEEEKQKKEEEKKQKEAERLEKLKQKELEKVKKEEERKRQQEEKRLELLKKEEEKKKAEEARLQEKAKKEEERKKQEEAKLQEKLKKEEERKKLEEAKLQEKLKKEEERKKKEEEKERERMKLEEKKQKQAQMFSSFFKKSDAPKVTTIENGTVKTVSVEEVEVDADAEGFIPLPFQIKTDMAIAPMTRRKLGDEARELLEKIVNGEDAKSEEVYLKVIKTQKRSSIRTELCMKSDSDVQVLDDSSKPEGCARWRMKLVQFHENRRPAYWGTWKRKPVCVRPRAPFNKEEEVDYEFDSDDEWEDEPEDAEEIEDSGGEAEEKEEVEEEEDEEGWMVPHGYLSDSERDGKKCDLEDMKTREKEFYKSLKEKTMIGVPYIQTVDLSVYQMRLCPVFKSAEPPKVIRIRKRPSKKPSSQETPGSPSKSNDDEEPPQLVPATVDIVKASRKSSRAPKAPKDNPYEKRSGFLALELPSDDEEDMDWAEGGGEENSEEEESSGSDADSEEDDDEEMDSEDLFSPVKKK